ncbi:hypothetical protein OIV83_005336 [Microbotryomycetes sp. JL201]|nr:hypothetical protein OIV83_005336 [Microbotryomycetes sp. JL201]
MTAWTVHSVSIPSHSICTSPSPHVLFQIKTTTSPSLETFTTSKRYSDFERLETELCRAVGERPSPGVLPPKYKFAGVSRWFTCGSTSSSSSSTSFSSQDEQAVKGTIKGLNEDDLVQRRMGLERYLKTIVGSRDTRWSTCEPLRDFLVGAASSDARGADDGSNGSTDRTGQWTVAGWTNESESVRQATRLVKDQLVQRDKLVQDKRSEVHKLTSESKKSLVELVRRTGNLAQGLEELSQRGQLADGEIQRRGDIVQQLQDELGRVGQAINAAPRIGVSGTSSSTVDRRHLLTSSQATRGTLGQPARVLGYNATRQPIAETSETRPLDNQGLLQLQQTYIQDQDSKLDSLTAALRRQRVLGEMIHQELKEHDEVLDDIDKSTDRVKGKIKAAEKQMKKL